MLIRQLVICPCLYGAVLLEDLEVESSKEVLRRTRTLNRLKATGDRVLLALAALHGALIAYVCYYFLRDTFADGRGFELWIEVCVSEGINFWVWFVKMAPLFLALFPVDRAIWYGGGTLRSRLVAGCRDYESTPEFNDPRFPRCVEPETLAAEQANLSTFFRGLASKSYAHSLSTFNSERASPRATAPDGPAAPTRGAGS